MRILFSFLLLPILGVYIALCTVFYILISLINYIIKKARQ